MQGLVRPVLLFVDLPEAFGEQKTSPLSQAHLFTSWFTHLASRFLLPSACIPVRPAAALRACPSLASYLPSIADRRACCQGGVFLVDKQPLRLLAPVFVFAAHSLSRPRPCDHPTRLAVPATPLSNQPSTRAFAVIQSWGAASSSFCGWRWRTSSKAGAYHPPFFRLLLRLALVVLSHFPAFTSFSLTHCPFNQSRGPRALSQTSLLLLLLPPPIPPSPSPNSPRSACLQLFLPSFSETLALLVRVAATVDDVTEKVGPSLPSRPACSRGTSRWKGRRINLFETSSPMAAVVHG